MVASYQEQLSELFKKKLNDASLPSMYKWTRKDERMGLNPRNIKSTSILIETKSATFSRCLNGCENCEGFIEINGRRYSCRCIHHHSLVYSDNKVGNSSRRF